FLVGQAMQRPGERSHAARKREIGVAQGGAHQVGSVRRSVTAFVVGVNGQVQAHQVHEVVARNTQHVGEVGAPVQVDIGTDMVALVVGAAVDIGGQAGQARDEVHGILVGGVPVFFFTHAVFIAVRKHAGRLHGRDSYD